jgi:signal transduction histidine kinase
MAMEQARWQQEAIQAKAREDAMRETDAMKNEFLAMTAHEFRNPLAVILMRTQSTLRALRRSGNAESSAPTPAALQDHLEIVAAQTRLLNNIVTTFLDAARINQGQFTLKNETVDLALIIKQVVEDHTYLTENHQLLAVIREEHAPFLVYGDKARLFQIFANLLENAIKYSPQGGPITVTLSRNLASQNPEQPETLEICVADRGIGIPLHAHARLFERFYRVPGTAGERTRGIGLGLYIVAQMIQMHQGEIRLESEGIPGEGSRFIITLPALPRSAHASL